MLKFHEDSHLSKLVLTSRYRGTFHCDAIPCQVMNPSPHNRTFAHAFMLYCTLMNTGCYYGKILTAVLGTTFLM